VGNFHGKNLKEKDENTMFDDLPIEPSNAGASARVSASVSGAVD
jgi:hypothetical protein